MPAVKDTGSPSQTGNCCRAPMRRPACCVLRSMSAVSEAVLGLAQDSVAVNRATICVFWAKGKPKTFPVVLWGLPSRYHCTVPAVLSTTVICISVPTQAVPFSGCTTILLAMEDTSLTESAADVSVQPPRATTTCQRPFVAPVA